MIGPEGDCKVIIADGARRRLQAVWVWPRVVRRVPDLQLRARRLALSLYRRSMTPLSGASTRSASSLVR